MHRRNVSRHELERAMRENDTKPERRVAHILLKYAHVDVRSPAFHQVGEEQAGRTRSGNPDAHQSACCCLSTIARAYRSSRATPVTLATTRAARANGNDATLANNSRRVFAFGGRNPTKTNRSASSPAADTAAATAEGPGIGTTGCPASCAARTRRAPGSLIAGVPASLTMATLFLSASAATSEAARRTSLWACSDTAFVPMP